MSLNRQTEKQPFRLLQTFKQYGVKMAIIVALLSTVTLNLAFAEENPKEAYSTIYHVYSGTDYLGAVSEQKKIDQVINQKQQQVSAEYPELSVQAGTNIEVIPEQVFTVAVNDEVAIEKLQSALVVEASAYTLQINGQIVGYLKDQAAYDEALRLLKLQYVSVQELDAFNANTHNVPLSENNQTRITNISLTADVTGAEAKVNPADILTAQQAVDLMNAGTLENEVYAVQQGDVLGAIAKAHNLTVAQLISLNKGLTGTTTLKIGQQLNVTVKKPLIAVNVTMEKYRVETIAFTKESKQDATMLKGESTVTQQGKDGQKQVLYTITSQNGVRTAKSVASEKVTTPAVNEVTVVGTKVIPSLGTGTFAWPAVGGYISSHMGSRFDGHHRGIDIARPSDRTIKASDNGVVTAVGWEGTYGNRVVIDHNNGYKTLYAHLASSNVKVGQVVGQGAAIGVMGTTGNSTGIHLHFEVQLNGALVNPMSVLN